MGRDKFSADFQLMFRLLKASLFIGSVSVIAILHVKNFTVGDLFASILAFLPTGWALLQVSGNCQCLSNALVFRWKLPFFCCTLRWP